MRDEDILLRMLSRGLPLTKAAYLDEFYSGDLGPTFPLDAEIAAVVPAWLPGPMPEDAGDLLFPHRILGPAGPLTTLRRNRWPWTKAAYVRALYEPEVLEEDEVESLLAVWVPANLPGDFPGSADDLVLSTSPPEARALAKTRWWPSARAVSVAMHTRGCGKDEAIVEFLLQDRLVKQVEREFGLSREGAAIAITRVEPIAAALMSRHGFTKDVAIIELIREVG